MPTGYFFDIVTAWQHVAEEGGPKAAVALLDGFVETDRISFDHNGNFSDGNFCDEGNFCDSSVMQEDALYKRRREEHFPAELIEKALKVKLEDGQASVEYASLSLVGTWMHG